MGEADFTPQEFTSSEDLTNPDRRFDSEWGDPRTYLEQYYPPLETDSRLILEISAKYAEMRRANGNKIDIKELQAAFPHLNQTSSEGIENYLLLDFLARVNLEYSKVTNRKAKILNLGAGPTAYPFIALAEIADEMIPGEYLETNREELERWRTNSPNSFDWSTYAQVSNVLNNKYLPHTNTTASQLEAEAQHKTKPAEPINFFDRMDSQPPSYSVKTVTRQYEPESIDYQLAQWQANEIGTHPVTTETTLVDQDIFVASFFGPESATENIAQWKKAIEYQAHTADIGSKEGWLLWVTINNAQSYSVGESELPAVSVNHQDLLDFLRLNGREIIIEEEITGSDIEKDHYSGMSFVLAKYDDKAQKYMDSFARFLDEEEKSKRKAA